MVPDGKWHPEYAERPEFRKRERTEALIAYLREDGYSVHYVDKPDM